MVTVPTSGGPRERRSITPDARIVTPGLSAPDVRLNAPTLNAPQYETPRLRAPTLRPGLQDPNAIQHIRLSSGGAEQQMQMGQNLGAAGDVLAKAAMQMQLKVNATVVDDALNQAREAAARITYGSSDGKGGMTGGYRNLKNYAAIKRDSGKALDEEVAEDFNSQVQEIAKSKLTNADQRTAFDAQAATISGQLRQGAISHQAEQFDSYFSGVYKGAVQNQTQTFALNDPTDMTGQRQSIETLDSSVATLALHNGASAQELEVGQRAARSAAVGGLFDRVMADKKYATAQALLNEYGGNGEDGKPKIDADALVKMKLSLDGKVGIQLGQDLARSIWNDHAAPAYQAGDADRGFNIAVHMESRGRQVDANGKVLKSSAGAMGVAQLMPDTAKGVAKSLGRPELAELAFQPTKEGEAANLLLGRTYFNQMLTRYNGDTAKAMAAYNAGPGRLDEALKTSAKVGGDWLARMPEETRNYVSNGMQSFGSGEGRQVKPKKADLYARLDAQTTDPDVRRAGRAEIDQFFTNADYDEREGHESAYAEGIRIVNETGSINNVDPKLKARMDPKDYVALDGFAKKKANGDDVVTDTAAYLTATNPAALKAMTPNQLETFRQKLSPSDFNTARNLYQQIHSPQAGKSADDLDVTTLDKIVGTRLQYLGVKLDPKDEKDAARLGAIMQFTHQYVLDRQRQQGGKFTDYASLQKAVDEMFTRQSEWKGMLTARTGLTMTAQPKDIPDKARDELVKKFKARGINKPSDAQIIGAYLNSQFYGG